MTRTIVLFITLVGLSTAGAWAQAGAPEQVSVPIYRITVVGRTVKAVNYLHRSGQTKIDFRGTSLMPNAHGSADVAGKQGAVKINAEFKDIGPATNFGAEYLTYVLWAITPEGRPINLGEVLPGAGGKTKIEVTSDVQAFGLIVTAEPYFAVTQPSDVVVMENVVRNDTVGKVEEVDAKYELLRRGQYTAHVNPSDLEPLIIDSRVPVELYEARNAVRIARWTGADHYAGATFDKARQLLAEAQADQESRAKWKVVATTAREAVQTAEDARLITIKKMEQEEHAEAKAEAKAEKAAAEQAKEQAAVAAHEKAEAERARNDALADSQTAQTQATQAERQAEQSRLQAQRAQQQAQQAETDKAAMRARLRDQLNLILETRDTARGLIMNMSDVLFDTGKYTLKPVAREKLARAAGVLLAYPGLTIEVDGHTDDVGSDEFNQTLSEERARAVRDYLVQQGVAPSAIAARGFGKTEPVASNDSSTGRRINRRVELVVSGDAIGSTLGSESASRGGQQ
ncbi:MAG TPA: OmpA family protein [Terriglobia bacterium]|nr:OmpA family protein [Terriglobia bacterium]